MNRLVLALASVASSLVVACAAPTAEESVAAPPAVEEAAAETSEAKPHSAPARAAGPTAREGYVVEPAENGMFVERRIEDRSIPSPNAEAGPSRPRPTRTPTRPFRAIKTACR